MEEIKINSDNYWFKIVEFLQSNWALIDRHNNKYVVYFILQHNHYDPPSKVFDTLTFKTREEAEEALRNNGFGLFSEDKGFQEIEVAPPPPFVEGKHPNGNIYSSGKYWK
jgi:hypothetical protein